MSALRLVSGDGPPPAAPLAERLLTARELGEQLGFAAATIVDWAQREEIPGFKIGGRLRFRASEVEAWLQERRLA